MVVGSSDFAGLKFVRYNMGDEPEQLGARYEIKDTLKILGACGAGGPPELLA